RGVLQEGHRAVTALHDAARRARQDPDQARPPRRGAKGTGRGRGGEDPAQPRGLDHEGRPRGQAAARRDRQRTLMSRILIVDDEPEIVRGLEDNLRFEAYQTSTAGDGREALALAAREAPDLILLDIMMPGLSGWDVCRELRG